MATSFEEMIRKSQLQRERKYKHLLDEVTNIKIEDHTLRAYWRSLPKRWKVTLLATVTRGKQDVSAFNRDSFISTLQRDFSNSLLAPQMEAT